MTKASTIGSIKTAALGVGFFVLLLTGIFIGFPGSAGLLSLKPAGATATSTVRGSAWWGDTYQYVYFNCHDDIIGDLLDQAGNLYYPPMPFGFHFYSSPCLNLVHGVYLDANNNFSGSAWNEVKGLITYDATTTPPDAYAFNTHCLHTCNLSNSCLACYNESDQKVYGWARVLSDGTLDQDGYRSQSAGHDPVLELEYAGFCPAIIFLPATSWARPPVP